MATVNVDTFDTSGRKIGTETLTIPDPSPQELNAQTLRDRASQALTANATFLALASPTQAQTLAQVKTLTKECNALIRLALGLLDDVSGT